VREHQSNLLADRVEM